MRILIFILLKILEIVVFVSVPYGLGRLVAGQEHPIATWFLGLLFLAMGAAILFMGIALCLANWKWAKKIKDKLKSN